MVHSLEHFMRYRKWKSSRWWRGRRKRKLTPKKAWRRAPKWIPRKGNATRPPRWDIVCTKFPWQVDIFGMSCDSFFVVAVAEPVHRSAEPSDRFFRGWNWELEHVKKEEKPEWKRWQDRGLQQPLREAPGTCQQTRNVTADAGQWRSQHFTGERPSEMNLFWQAITTRRESVFVYCQRDLQTSNCDMPVYRWTKSHAPSRYF